MELKNEHTGSMYHLISEENRDAVTYNIAKADEIFTRKWQYGIHIVIIVKGIGYVSYGQQANMRVQAGDMFVLPPHSEIRVEAISPLESMHFCMLNKYNLCKNFPVKKLLDRSEHSSRRPSVVLKANKRILDYVDFLKDVVEDGVQHTYYFDLKQNEFLYYLGTYYSDEELAAFLEPIDNSDSVFSEKIYEHLHEIKTLEDIARVTGYSYSGIKKKFERLFGVSFTKWLAKQKSYLVYQEINNSNKTFREIAADLGFASASHLDSFCKKMFHMTPGEIRKKNNRRYIESLMKELK
jgi:AraC-like DNA-binding protein/quercetin dioxygenase-like cupin family protein